MCSDALSRAGARGSQVQILWFVVRLCCVSLFFSLCVCLLLLSLHVYSCVFYIGLFSFFSSLCGALGELGLNPVLYVPWHFAGSAINRSVNLAPSLSGCWGSDRRRCVPFLAKGARIIVKPARWGFVCRAQCHTRAFEICLYSRQRKYTVIYSNSHAVNTPLASDDMAFVDSLKYQCAKFGIERPERHIHVHSGLINTPSRIASPSAIQRHVAFGY